MSGRVSKKVWLGACSSRDRWLLTFAIDLIDSLEVLEVSEPAAITRIHRKTSQFTPVLSVLLQA